MGPNDDDDLNYICMAEYMKFTLPYELPLSDIRIGQYVLKEGKANQSIAYHDN